MRAAIPVSPSYARDRVSVDGLQLLARLEAYRLAWRNGNLGASTRIAPDAGLTGPDVEHAKPAQFNAITLGERPLHAPEHSFHGQFGLGFSDSGLVHHFIDDVELDHRRLPPATESVKLHQVVDAKGDIADCQREVIFAVKTWGYSGACDDQNL